MKTVFHPADQRGHANHGWLDAHHSFSFASWYDPSKIHFGALRVLNDDIIAGSMGFGTHPHDNMEIITIPLVGALKHRDSMGNEATITAGEIQVMSAGTGIQHSEFNATNETLNLFQIWVFPNKKNVTPRYDQQLLDTAKMKNNFAQILSPDPADDGVWIHQDAWFHLGEFDKGQSANYTVKSANNGVYVLVVEGQITINGQELNKRDALGVWNTEAFAISFTENSKVLLLDVPMEFDY
ncbi:MAG: pirin family protein [Fluviicola sp.]|nr:pirin family protein [Fluviicola sp.]MBP6271340.1 pirin family protein [Fluviicola sp.]